MENSKPDFLLESTDTNVPAVAIFTDGRAYHAAPAHNRLADDASKREILRETGRIVLGISAVDLQQEEAGAVSPPAWFSEQVLGQVIQQAPFMARPAAYATLKSGPIDWLMSWVSSPDRDSLGKVARAVPMFLLSGAEQVQAPAAVSLDQVGRSVLLGEELGRRRHPTGRRATLRPAGRRHRGRQLCRDRARPRRPGRGPRRAACRGVAGMAAAVERPGAAGLADDDHDRPAGWRTGRRSRRPLSPISRPRRRCRPSGRLRSTWRPLAPSATSCVALAGRPGLVPPEVGLEGPEGIPLDLAWPDARIAVDVSDLTEADLEDLRRAGWQVLPPEGRDDHPHPDRGRHRPDGVRGDGTCH